MQNSLSRVLPLRTAVSTSAGLASAAVNFLAAVEVAEYAGGQSAWLAILVAGVLIVFAGSNFSELNGLFPSAAAIRVWIRRGVNDQVSLVSSFVYMFTVVFVIAADAFVLGHTFSRAIPAIPALLWILAILALVTWSNSRGIKVAGAVQDTNAFVLLGTLMLFSLMVLARTRHLGQFHYFHLGSNWFEAIALGIFIFVGFEWVTPLAEEFQDFRAIPRGMYIALGLIAVAFGLFSLALTVAFPHVHLLAHSFVPQLLVGMKAMGKFGFWWMAFVTLTTAMTTFNGGLLSASRFVYALAREKALPSWFSRLNGRLVPQNALMTLAGTSFVLAIVVYFTGQYLFLINAGAGVESFMYALSSWLVISLRRRDPKRARPFHAFGYPVVPVIMGVIFLGLGVEALLTPTGPSGFPWSLVFFAVLLVLMVIYVLVAIPRLKEKKPGLGQVSKGSKGV
ncbi:MAG: APC family permease [Firmicutes bacterium]|nr:APC family permease [Bacillota bacterium]